LIALRDSAGVVQRLTRMTAGSVSSVIPGPDGRTYAIVAFGVIIEGSTAHAGLIAGEITRALMELGLEWETPVIHEVLLVRDEAQARARCLGDEINRGAEAARAAVRMVDALRVIRD